MVLTVERLYHTHRIKVFLYHIIHRPSTVRTATNTSYSLWLTLKAEIRAKISIPGARTVILIII